MKLAHLHLILPSGEKTTLLCRFRDNSIQYTHFEGWGNYGDGLPLSKIDCVLPLDNRHNKSSYDWTSDLISIIDASPVELANIVDNKVTFND